MSSRFGEAPLVTDGSWSFRARGLVSFARVAPATRHPDAATLHAAVQLAAAPVLLEEGVERGEEIGHGSGSVANAPTGATGKMPLLADPRVVGWPMRTAPVGASGILPGPQARYPPTKGQTRLESNCYEGLLSGILHADGLE